MQNQITKPTLLLGNDGNIIQPGYCKSMLYEYNREAITARKSRIKEWDYYYISNDNYALCLTIADMGYVGGLSISVMDFVKPDQLTNSSVFFFPMGKLNMPRTSTVGDCQWQNGISSLTTCQKRVWLLPRLLTKRGISISIKR